VRKQDEKDAMSQDHRMNENNKSIGSGEIEEKENDQLTDLEQTNKGIDTKDLDMDLQASQDENDDHNDFPKMDAASLFRKTTTRQYSLPTTNTYRVEDETRIARIQMMGKNKSLTDRDIPVISAKSKVYRHIASYH